MAVIGCSKGDAMRSRDFATWMNGLEAMTPAQRLEVSQRLRALESHYDAYELIERRVVENPTCPHCGAGHAACWGTALGLQCCKCHACRKTFSALTGTASAGLRQKDKWLQFSHELAQGHSVRRSAVNCRVHPNTTLRWRHRFLAAPERRKFSECHDACRIGKLTNTNN